MKLALKIDVDTFRGTREGVPRLVNALQRHNAGATFLFSLGPDHTGRAIKRVFRPGFLKKVSRTSVVRHYGLRTLMYGTLLPGPSIGRRCKKILQRVRDDGFEVGVHCWDHIAWQDGVVRADAKWTSDQMHLAFGRFNEVFGELPRVHGAAGWQMNRHAYRLQQRMALDYASDTRGHFPFLPVYQGELIACPQLPTTLPTFDELIGLDGVTEGNVAERLLALSTDPLPTGHVYTLHAELEGMRLLDQFERLLEGWQTMGYELVSMRTLYESLDLAALPHCHVEAGEVQGRSGNLALQGVAFLAA
jgi:peptidoglycan/xylan/chitin deacetylase (PgdA/CDA1 family)